MAELGSHPADLPPKCCHLLSPLDSELHAPALSTTNPRPNTDPGPEETPVNICRSEQMPPAVPHLILSSLRSLPGILPCREKLPGKSVRGRQGRRRNGCMRQEKSLRLTEARGQGTQSPLQEGWVGKRWGEGGLGQDSVITQWGSSHAN